MRYLWNNIYPRLFIGPGSVFEYITSEIRFFLAQLPYGPAPIVWMRTRLGAKYRNVVPESSRYTGEALSKIMREDANNYGNSIFFLRNYGPAPIVWMRTRLGTKYRNVVPESSRYTGEALSKILREDANNNRNLTFLFAKLAFRSGCAPDWAHKIEMSCRKAVGTQAKHYLKYCGRMRITTEI